MTQRLDGREPQQIRPITMQLGYLDWAEGSVLLEMGRTRVLAAASWESKVPRWLQGTGRGWVTAEYSLLPRSTSTRTEREAAKGKLSGRTQEIQRLIGRSLRGVTRLDRMGEQMITVDCDILQADGGTRTASITAGYIALGLAIQHLTERQIFKPDAGILADSVAAVSAGIVAGERYLDLNYEEDSRAEVDLNVVMTGDGRLVEVQGTAEGEPFGRDDLDAMLDLAAAGIAELTEIQRSALASPPASGLSPA